MINLRSTLLPVRNNVQEYDMRRLGPTNNNVINARFRMLQMEISDKIDTNTNSRKHNSGWPLLLGYQFVI